MTLAQEFLLPRGRLGRWSMFKRHLLYTGSVCAIILLLHRALDAYGLIIIWLTYFYLVTMNGVKRLHDLNVPGWLVPIFGVGVLLAAFAVGFKLEPRPGKLADEAADRQRFIEDYRAKEAGVPAMVEEGIIGGCFSLGALCLLILSGTEGENRYGPQPRTGGRGAVEKNPACAERFEGKNSEPATPPHRQDESKSFRIPKRPKVKVVCLLILAVGVLAYCFQLSVQFRAFKNQLAVVKGIRIGASRDEVKYRLGFPLSVLGPVKREDTDFKGGRWVYTVSGPDNDLNKMPATTKVEDYSEWVYEEASSNVRLTVEFNKSCLIASINLYSDNDKPFGWGPIAGLYSGDSEDKLLRLGAPSRQNLDGFTKTLEYRDIGIEVWLTKGRAYSITIKEPQDKTSLFWRLMRSQWRRA